MAVRHIETVSARLDAVDLDVLVVEEWVKETDGVRAATDAGDEGIGQFAFGLHDLLAHLTADDRLEVAHHLRIGMRARRRADDVVGVADVGHPVAERLVHGVLERALPRT